MAGNSNSGRPGKPAVVHLLHGNRSKKNAGELLDQLQNPVVPVEAPPKPDWLSESAAAEWDRVSADLVKLGLISALDMMALAAYCEAVADYQTFTRLIAEMNERGRRGDVQTFATGAKQISVWRQLRNDAEKRANQAGALFGFSPLSRRNLKAAPAPQGELFPNEQRAIADKYF